MPDETIVQSKEEVVVRPAEREVVQAVSELCPVTVLEAPEAAPTIVAETASVQVLDTIREVVVVVSGPQGPPGPPGGGGNGNSFFPSGW